LVTPIHVIRREQQRLDALGLRARRAVQNSLGQRQLKMERFSSSLAHLNPEGVLARGYSIVQLENGAVVQDAASLNAGDSVGIRFHRGQARVTVDSTSTE
jgi:exodeoxyribonuclease VII large subunit